MTLWKTMLSVGWCHHKLFIMPFPAISVSNLLSRLNDLTFTFGIWRGRRTSRGCCYLWGGAHNSGHQVCGGTRHHGSAPHLGPHFERACRRFTCSPHPTPPNLTPPHLHVRWDAEKGNRKSACQTLPLHPWSASLQARGGTKRHGSKKKKNQSRSLTINIYKYINIYINWIYCKWFPFLLCFSLYIGLHIL